MYSLFYLRKINFMKCFMNYDTDRYKKDTVEIINTWCRRELQMYRLRL